MPTITAAIDQLAKFSDKENIPKIIEDLQSLEALKSPKNASDSVIEELRKGLKNLLSQRNVKKDKLSLADAAYDGLLALAEFKPLNEEDPITQSEIPKEDKVFVSTGHQFSLTNLIHYHHTRDYGSNLGETYQSKWLLSPLTNLQFDPIDVAHISKVAKERGTTVENLKSEALVQQQMTHTTQQPDNLTWRNNPFRELEAPQTILPSSVTTVINGIAGFFQRLFNTTDGLTNTQTQIREDDLSERRHPISIHYEPTIHYTPVFSRSPLSQPTSSVSNTQSEEPTSTCPRPSPN